jgi:hypothetical protein
LGQFLTKWSGSAPENIEFLAVNSWEVVTYSLKTGDCKQSNFKANLIKEGTWIEIHLSSSCNEEMNLKEYLEKISVEIKN